MRLVLAAHGLLPADEYQQRRAECLQAWHDEMQAEVNRVVAEGLRHLLEKHEGTKQ